MIDVLVLNGSPRGKNGNTNTLTEAFLQGLSESGKEIAVTRHFVANMNIHDCTGCYACWNRTPGKCAIRDDMEQILSDMRKADVIVYATPLYHFGMTAALKRVFERTLPLSKPYMVMRNGHYRHPSRYETKAQKRILISNCGFPERHHFDAMVTHFNILAGGKLDGTILCAGGEMLRVPDAKELCRPYLESVVRAGRELASDGSISADTSSELAKNFVDLESFVDVANLSWNVPGDNPPSPDVAHGRVPGAAGLENVQTAQAGNGAAGASMSDYMEGMVRTFRPEGAKGIKLVLQMEFPDIGEAYHLDVGGGMCVLHEGRAENPTTTIRAPSDVWRDIGAGKINGASALMSGKYKVLGDFSIMMKFSEIFGDETSVPGDADSADEPAKKERGFLKFVSPMLWLSVVSFIPWYIFWFAASSASLAVSLIPLGFSIALYAYRKAFLKITPFDTGNVLFFAALVVWRFVDRTGYLANGNLISSIGLAAIWGSTLMTETPLTSWYSSGSYSAAISRSEVFAKINRILTMFWVLVYLFQAVARVALPADMSVLRFLIVYGVLVAAGFFTAGFPMRYMTKISAGK